MIALYVLGIIFIISAVLFISEIKKAPLLDDKEPFLEGDYNPKKDPTLFVYDYAETFCKNCKFYDGTAMCLHEDNIGVVDMNLIDSCKKESMFEAI
jgi:hypothetical protein